MIKQTTLFFLSVMAMSLLSSCGGSSDSHSAFSGDTIPMQYARNLELVDFEDYTIATFRNPWDTTRTLSSYVLAAEDAAIPKKVINGRSRVTVPLKKSVVYTSVHTSLINELGALDAITGICDANFILSAPVRERLEKGEIVDCGSSMTPNLEKIMMLRPQALLLSAFENSNDHNKVAQMGIPIIDCAEYMESSPLAQAEWMKFFGRLYGKGAIADSLFSVVSENYNAIKRNLANVEKRPSVLTDLIYGQSWSMPGGKSTTGILIEDAGGKNPFDIYDRGGGIQLAPEQVLYQAKDADIWLIKYTQNIPLTLRQLKDDSPVYSQFSAFQNGNVYGCNTVIQPYYEETPYHPDWLLLEMASLLHPELGLESLKHYYNKLQP